MNRTGYLRGRGVRWAEILAFAIIAAWCSAYWTAQAISREQRFAQEDAASALSALVASGVVERGGLGGMSHDLSMFPLIDFVALLQPLGRGGRVLESWPPGRPLPGDLPKLTPAGGAFLRWDRTGLHSVQPIRTKEGSLLLWLRLGHTQQRGRNPLWGAIGLALMPVLACAALSVAALRTGRIPPSEAPEGGDLPPWRAPSAHGMAWGPLPGCDQAGLAYMDDQDRIWILWPGQGTLPTGPDGSWPSLRTLFRDDARTQALARLVMAAKSKGCPASHLLPGTVPLWTKVIPLSFKDRQPDRFILLFMPVPDAESHLEFERKNSERKEESGVVQDRSLDVGVRVLLGASGLDCRAREKAPASA